jgi:creatinine amidohydrolase
VLLNGHGGNEFRAAIRELLGKTSVFVCMVEWWKMMADVRAQLIERRGEHACELETSLMLSIAPELVRLDRADKGWVRPTRIEAPVSTAVGEGWIFFARPWEKLTVQAGVGDPRKATREKGDRYLAEAARRIGKFLAELARAPMDEDFPFRPGELVEPGR